MLTVGTTAPAFTLTDQNGRVHSLAETAGNWCLIYFYPKDDTPGCTKEACAIAEVYDQFTALDVKVYGVSRDSGASHKKFADKYQLPFTLLSDSEGEVVKAYEAARGEAGTARVSYLIDPAGKIAKVYAKVDPAGHALTILNDLKELISVK